MHIDKAFSARGRAATGLGFVLGVGLGAALLACGPGGGEASGGGAAAPIKIGHFASLTGDTATFGQ
ncbi:MAG TPA: hypothetical protein VKE73_10295, partial [Myxococcota bacterium]|nr:hypothetical protein [Myxococcota bacterium]